MLNIPDSTVMAVMIGRRNEQHLAATAQAVIDAREDQLLEYAAALQSTRAALDAERRKRQAAEFEIRRLRGLLSRQKH